MVNRQGRGAAAFSTRIPNEEHQKRMRIVSNLFLAFQISMVGEFDDLTLESVAVVVDVLNPLLRAQVWAFNPELSFFPPVCFFSFRPH